MLVEALKTIGFGPFINGTYDLMHNDISLSNIYISVGSLAIVVASYYLQRRQDER